MYILDYKMSQTHLVVHSNLVSEVTLLENYKLSQHVGQMRALMTSQLKIYKPTQFLMSLKKTMYVKKLLGEGCFLWNLQKTVCLVADCDFQVPFNPRISSQPNQKHFTSFILFAQLSAFLNHFFETKKAHFQIITPPLSLHCKPEV